MASRITVKTDKNIALLSQLVFKKFKKETK